MKQNEILNKIASLNSGEVVTVTNFYYSKVLTTTGKAYKGHDYTSNKDWFYIQPLGDTHAGASITKNEIIAFVD